MPFTNLQALQAKLNRSLPAIALELALQEEGLEATADYVAADNKRPVEIALAGLIYTVALAPKSVRELDYQVTEHDLDGLLKLRQIIIVRYGLVDELAPKDNTINGASPW